VVAANAPDVDVLSYAGGPYLALSFRRGITHGVPAMLVLPFVVAGAMLAWDRWVRRRREPTAPAAPYGALLALSALGVLTHPALDWLNTYGMRW
jgi:inner membrane protein